MPFHLIRDDITCVHAAAIVNAANPALKMGGGVCGSIFRAAGAEEMQKACDAIGHCEPGQAVVTPGFRLPKAKWVIHTPGPVWHGGKSGEEEILASCYRSALRLAEDKGIPSIAFPLISAGVYGFPRELALRIASETIREFLLEESRNDPEVMLVLFERSTVLLAGNQLYEEITDNLDDDAPALLYAAMERKTRRLDERELSCQKAFMADAAEMYGAPAAMPVGSSVAEEDVQRIGREVIRTTLKEETFVDRLFRMIDERKLSDVDVYKNANLDRRLFSKIRSNRGYKPKKGTAFALCLSLKLQLEEAQELLASAGIALAPAEPVDQLVTYCLKHHYYNVYDVNEILYEMDQKQLGAG